MTADEARELFSAAYDGMLAEADQKAFDDALSADASLEEEYDELRLLLDEAHQLDEEGALGDNPALQKLVDEAHELAADDDLTVEETPDLLSGVQERIRVRSRGRFYRDRFSQKTGATALLPILLGVVMLLVVGVSWLMIHHVQVEAPEGVSSQEPERDSGG